MNWEIRPLPVFLPDAARARKAAHALERETQIQWEIDRLRHSQADAAKDLWRSGRFEVYPHAETHSYSKSNSEGGREGRRPFR